MRHCALPGLICLTLACACGAAPLQTFTIRDYLGHEWREELVHLDFSVKTAATDLTLVDAEGRPVLCQFTDLKREGGTVSGKVWTVLSLRPGAAVSFDLVPGRPGGNGVQVTERDGLVVLSNDRVAVALPRWGAKAVKLTDLPAPVRGLASPGGEWLGGGQWFDEGADLQVQQAVTTVVERGPIRATVCQSFALTDGRTYQATVSLAALQDAAIISEEAPIEAPQAGWRFSFAPGLAADRVFWQNQGAQSELAKSWERVVTAPAFEQEQVICRLRPWSFWWTPGLAEWAGVYREGADPLVGVMALRPSRWSPTQWDGFEKTEIPVTARAGGGLDLTLRFAARTRRAGEGGETLEPVRRQWALVLGTSAEARVDGTAPAALRLRLLKYSEFPLDEVLRYGFDYTPAPAARTHPFLLFSRQEVQRVRRQYQEVPALQAVVDQATTALQREQVGRTLREQGEQEFFTRHYHHNNENWLLAYLGRDDPQYAEYLVAITRGLRRYLLDIFLENPTRPAIGAYGPWFSEFICRLAYYHDLAAGTGLLTPEEDAQLRATSVFCAHFLAHPDYWNPAVGLASANPNMTSSIKLPLGVQGLFLAGHPQADGWLTGAEEELRRELQDWISPGGAWIECPGYQAASLDGIFLLATALRQVKGRDYFADPNLKATMEYYGQILTPPDPRYPTWRKPEEPAWSTLPTIGDTPAGQVACFNGWMAAATAAQDPDYSARQQFYWQVQGGSFIRAGRGAGVILALTDYALPATPPTALAAAFPGFGSVMRTSWTDPRASYLVHRTGPHLHHYHFDFGEILLAAKGAPLAWDFGNQYQPISRPESWYHNRVSFSKPGGKEWGGTGELLETVFLPHAADYSYGRSIGGGNQQDHRHVLLVKSDDPLGANYVLVRDSTADGQPEQRFYWNLWCLSQQPEVKGSVVHFPGQMGVDLDVHLLAPANAPVEQDQWAWQARMSYWGDFAEEMFGMRVEKVGSEQDFLAVLYPRAAGQGEAKVTLVEGDLEQVALPTGGPVTITRLPAAAVQVEHMEGVDLLLLAPRAAGERVVASAGELVVQGEVALARRYHDGRLRLAVLKGSPAAALGGAGAAGWTLASAGPAALEVLGEVARGETSGPAHEVILGLPADWVQVRVTLDGEDFAATRNEHELRLRVPEGNHRFLLQRR